MQAPYLNVGCASQGTLLGIVTVGRREPLWIGPGSGCAFDVPGVPRQLAVRDGNVRLRPGVTLSWSHERRLSQLSGTGEVQVPVPDRFSVVRTRDYSLFLLPKRSRLSARMHRLLVELRRAGAPEWF